ncbi:unnamed protein product [Vitrella brassicaformis CCMP3155]|uniref:Importin N-terminal domain-containing protein n=2 Tax=Vitrella brassicaformis TaxID=1169539 RepID=A0A0G4FS32_VITBC|nr:unnamed protein product [Vitrella brassicaformis CCMP3155]|eukprot:CEM16917.1 unnamed protein product [Vitrella brassicaformis CCMP3155]
MMEPQALLLPGEWNAERVKLLDHVVTIMYSGNEKDRSIAHQVLNELKGHPESWTHVDTILGNSSNPNTKFFALSILENCIATRWKVLPKDQKEGMKTYVVNLTIKISSDESLQAGEKHFLTKLNETLIQIVKKEWPQNWESFIPDICGASRTNQSLCENNMKILNLLSEEVFEFGSEQMTSKKIEQLKDAMNEQFRVIYELCSFIFDSWMQQRGAVKPSLIKVTLSCIQHFLAWIPLGFVFETNLIGILIDQFWDPPEFRIECVKCLGEIAALHEGIDRYVDKLLYLFSRLIEKVSALPPESIEYETKAPPQHRIYWENFFNQLAIAIAAFLRYHLQAIEAAGQLPQHIVMQSQLSTALGTLVSITQACSNDSTFKTCIDFWHYLAQRLYENMRPPESTTNGSNGLPPPLLLDGGAMNGTAPQDAMQATGMDTSSDGNSTLAAPHSSPTHLGPGGPSCGGGSPFDLSILNPYTPIYNGVMSDVRRVLMLKMAKPPEVLIVIDEETGEVSRELQVDTAEVELYHKMREVMVYLTHLDQSNMEHIMLELLTQECLSDTTNGMMPSPQQPWNPARLNCLCWAMGSISGAMDEANEKRFVVTIIKDLLSLCEMKRGKENKAIVASCIMYVVGQYPRFLRAHWKFLKTVLLKLFEFMHETFPGVQKMACETFLKISQKCRKKFVQVQPAEAECFLAELTRPNGQLQGHTADLEFGDQQTFYEAVGYMIAEAPTQQEQYQYVDGLMSHLNAQWNHLLQAASQNEGILVDLNAMRQLSHFLRTNERVASSAGSAMEHQLGSIYQQVLRVYKYYSEGISSKVASNGPQIMGHSQIKGMRTFKRDTLKLVETFVEKAIPPDPHGPPGSQHQPAAGATGEIPETNGIPGGGRETQSSRRSELIQRVCSGLVPPLLEPVLADYRANHPQARDPEVLSLLSTLISKLSPSITPQVPRIFEMVFDPTLEMIKSDFQSYPDHRVNFYALLRACNTYCFDALFLLPEQRLRLFVDSLVWAIKHEHPSVADAGLRVLSDFLDKVLHLDPQLCGNFFKSYYQLLLHDIFVVLTDTLHKAGFKHQTIILMELVTAVDLGKLRGVTSKQEVMEYICNMLCQTFATLNRNQVEAFVLDLFNKSGNHTEFQSHIRDFLVQIKEYAGGDAEGLTELYRTERDEALQRSRQIEQQRLMEVPGLLHQYDPIRLAMDAANPQE